MARERLSRWTGVNEAYRVTVWDSCRDKQFAHSIGVTSNGSQVTTFDHVRVGRERCPIRVIRPIRSYLKELRDEGKIDTRTYRKYYLQAKGGTFKGKAHLDQHLRASGLLKGG